MSAVSNNVTPSSRAASTTARVASWSIRPPKLLHPSPTIETVRLPMARVSMPFDVRGAQWPDRTFFTEATTAAATRIDAPFATDRPSVSR
jgi:hypothetical protein